MLEPAQPTRSPDDVSLVVINANYALQYGLSPARDAIAVEARSSPYGNVVAIRKGDENRQEFQNLKEAVTAHEVRESIKEKYQGGVLPVFQAGGPS